MNIVHTCYECALAFKEKNHAPCCVIKHKKIFYIYILFLFPISFIIYVLVSFSLSVSNPVLSCPILRFQHGSCLSRGSEVLVAGSGQDGAEATRQEDEITAEGREAGDVGGHAAG